MSEKYREPDEHSRGIRVPIEMNPGMLSDNDYQGSLEASNVGDK
jgi:hypothetical protein